MISDLHIGYEATLKSEGISLQLKDSNYSVQHDLVELIQLTRANKVILLGDIKASTKCISKLEWRYVPEFFDFISRHASIYLVPGNHDGNIGVLLPQSVTIGSVKGIVLADTLLTHGHTMPSTSRESIKRIVMGHIHPTYSRENSIINSQRVWFFLKARKEKIFNGSEGLVDIVILPCFNGEIYLARHKSSVHVSPIIRRVVEYNAIRSALAVTLDGSIIAGDHDALAMLSSSSA